MMPVKKRKNPKYFTATPMTNAKQKMGIFIIVLGYHKPYSS